MNQRRRFMEGLVSILNLLWLLTSIGAPASPRLRRSRRHRSRFTCSGRLGRRGYEESRLLLERPALEERRRPVADGGDVVRMGGRPAAFGRHGVQPNGSRNTAIIKGTSTTRSRYPFVRAECEQVSE